MSDLNTISALASIPLPETEDIRSYEARLRKKREGAPSPSTALVVAPQTTSVTSVTEVHLVPFTDFAYSRIDYSSYSDEELHKANVQNIRVAKGMDKQFNSYVENRAIPAFRATIARLSKQGHRMNGQSHIEDYFKSIGTSYAAVRKMFSRDKQRLLQSMGYVPRPRTPKLEKPSLPDDSTKLFAEQGLKVCDLLCAGDVKAAHDLAKRIVEAAAANPLPKEEERQGVVDEETKATKGSAVVKLGGAVFQYRDKLYRVEDDGDMTFSASKPRHSKGELVFTFIGVPVEEAKKKQANKRHAEKQVLKELNEAKKRLKKAIRGFRWFSQEQVDADKMSGEPSIDWEVDGKLVNLSGEEFQAEYVKREKEFNEANEAFDILVEKTKALGIVADKRQARGSF